MNHQFSNMLQALVVMHIYTRVYHNEGTQTHTYLYAWHWYNAYFEGKGVCNEICVPITN
jgi:hypothetical protein